MVCQEDSNRTQHTVILTDEIHHSECIQSKISKGKGAWSKVQEKPGACIQKSSPKEVTQDMTMDCNKICEMSTKEAQCLGFY